VAVTVILEVFGRVNGAVYKPELEIVPMVAAPPRLTSCRDQVTPMSVEFCTGGVNC